MTKNISKTGSYLRLTGGSFLLGYGVVKKSPFVLTLGACVLAEGITQWCPLYDFLGISKGNEEQQTKRAQQASTNTKNPLAFNES